MKRVLLVLLFSTSLKLSSAIFAQETPFYIYYYSEEHQAFVIELADSGEMRLITPVPSDSAVRFAGPGWSPDGQWFAWFRRDTGSGLSDEAGIISPVSEQQVTTVNSYSQVSGMEWSPNSHFLLAAGITPACSVDSCLFSTHWLIDVQNDLVMATLDLAEGSTSRHTTFEWLPDNGGVVFYAMDGVAIGTVTPRTKVTLYSDGKVTKEPVTYEEWNTFTFLSPEETNERDEQFTSPQGRYLIGRATITDTETGVEAPLFTGMWSESEVGYLDAVDWHPSEEWAFLTFERGEGYFVTVLFKTDGTYQRELCTCYPGPNLIGWLPDNVDVDSIPLLADAP